MTDETGLAVASPFALDKAKLTPEDIVTEARRRANLLKAIIEEQKLYTLIGKNKYVHVEGWAILGEFMGGARPFTMELRREDRPGGHYTYHATVALQTPDDRSICRATSSCNCEDIGEGRKEFDHEKNEFQVQSMAQTRAQSKAYRMAHAWVMALAGFATTPAEEMKGVASKEDEEARPRFWCPEGCAHWHTRTEYPDKKTGELKVSWFCHDEEGKRFRDEQGNWCKCKLTFLNDEGVKKRGIEVEVPGQEPAKEPQSPQDEPNGGQQGQGTTAAPKATPEAARPQQKRISNPSQPLTRTATPALVALLYHDAAKAAQEQVKDLVETEWLNPGDFKVLFLTQLVEVFAKHGIGGLIPNEHFPLNGNGVMTYTHVLPTHEILANIRHDLLSVNWRALVGVEKEE